MRQEHQNGNVQETDTDRFILEQPERKYRAFNLNEVHVIVVGCLIEIGIYTLLY